jgi:glyoxylase I family protein
MHITAVHHIAIITTNYEVSKAFYTKVLGFTIIAETYRAERASYKLDLAINGLYQLELFSFPEAKERASYPEAKGLRHLAFAVPDIAVAFEHLQQHGITLQPIRVDEFTGKKFFFFYDPDGQPLEMYEQ